jgi:hypothetical protein
MRKTHSRGGDRLAANMRQASRAAGNAERQHAGGNDNSGATDYGDVLATGAVVDCGNFCTTAFTARCSSAEYCAGSSET